MSGTNNYPKRYYPKLSEVITIDDLPEFLSFAQDGLNAIFDKIHYKNLQYSKSFRGDAAFYSLDIVTGKALRLPLPFNLALILNPDLDGDSNISSFPVTLEYQWEILAFLKTFSLEGFSFSPEDFYLTGLNIFRLTENQVMAHTLNYFVEDTGDGESKYQSVVDQVNALYSGTSGYTPIVLPSDEEVTVPLLTRLISQHVPDRAASMVLFSIYVLDTDVELTRQRLSEFYNIMVPEGIESYIRKLITPRARVTLALNAAIEFPGNILKPVDAAGNVISGQVTKFQFAEALLYADTEAGIGYQLELAGSLIPTYAAIGNTGLILQIESLKLDLSKNSNIPEADLDGRPNDFVGVYARAISVAFPSKWFHDDDEPLGNSSTTLRLGGYDLLIGTGGISGTIMLESVPVVNPAVEFEYYNDKFTFDYPVIMFDKDVETDEIIEKTINNYTELKNFLQGLDSNLPYPFKYPLSLKPVGSSSSLVFDNARSYQQYLAGLNYNTLWKKIGGDNGFRVGFTKFDITFSQNVIAESNIQGALKIPRFTKPGTSEEPFQIEVSGHINEAGDFNLTASVDGGVPANLFGFVTFNFLTLEVGRQGDKFYLDTNCEVSFPNETMQKIIGDQKIVLSNLRIYSDGSMELAGGTNSLPANVSLHLGPVDVSVTGITFGSYQRNDRQYNYFGFDGSISIDPIGVDARGKGLKYYYTVDNGAPDSFIHFSSIEIDLVIPGNASAATAAAIIKGALSLPSPGESPEYSGSVSLSLPKMNMAASVGMRLMPKYPAFLLDVAVQLPAPIPIGPVSIYELNGLAGYRYAADKKAVNLPDSATWYDYYKAPIRGININKFSSPDATAGDSKPFSIGLGGVLGTSADSGYTFSSRVMLLLSMPDMFLVEGRAAVLSERISLSDTTKEPPFFAFFLWATDAVEAGFGADYKLPQDTGSVLSLQAEIQARFPRSNSSGWYINAGTKDKPNTAVLFKDFIGLRALSYLMLSAKGIEAGARADFELKKNFFGVNVHLRAYVGLEGSISFQGSQMGGTLAMGGSIDVNVWKVIYVGFGLDTKLSVEAPKPFLIFAELKVRGSIKVVFVKIGFDISIQLKWEGTSEVDKTPVYPIPDNRTPELVKAVHMLTNDSYKLSYFDHIPPTTINMTEKFALIPCDSYIDIKSAKGLARAEGVDTKLMGWNGAFNNASIEKVPPVAKAAGRDLRQVQHAYSIESIVIEILDNGTWKPYNPYKAQFPGIDDDKISNLIGSWQYTDRRNDTIRLLSLNPFEFSSQGEPGSFIPEEYGITASSIFCRTKEKPPVIVNVLDKAPGTEYYYNPNYAHLINGAYFNLLYAEAGAGTVQTGSVVKLNALTVTDRKNTFGFERSLLFSSFNALQIDLPEDARYVRLKLSTYSTLVRVGFYACILPENATAFVYELLEERICSAAQLQTEQLYTAAGDKGIRRIIIKPQIPAMEAINKLQKQIDSLYDDTYTALSGNVEVIIPLNVPAFAALKLQLRQLLGAASSYISQACEDKDICNLFFNQLAPDYPVKANTLGGIDIQKTQNFFHTLQQSGLGDKLQPYYSRYNNALEPLVYYYNQGIAGEALPYYAIINEAAYQMMQLLYTMGDCDAMENETGWIATLFHELEYLSVTDETFNLQIESQAAKAAEQLAMVKAISRYIQPVWRPESTYYIRFELSDTVGYSGTTTHRKNYFYAFQTAGAPGYVAYASEDTSPGADQLLTESKAKRLNTLGSYIDYKRSYPNADGNLLSAKPLFYSNGECRISLYFTKSYVSGMLSEWSLYQDMPALDYTIGIKIKDPASGVLIPYPLPEIPDDSIPVPLPANEENGSVWVEDENPLISSALQLFNNLLNDPTVECEVIIGEPLAPKSFAYGVIPTNLKPEKLYTALIYNYSGGAERQIHEFVFKTSRYGNFAEQVNSFVHADENGNTKEFVFELNVNIPDESVLNTVYAIVSGQNTNIDKTLSQLYAHPFDRVCEGLLGLPPLEYASGTEFNLLYNQPDDKLIGILLRNPEPFNNPRMPAGDARDTITVMKGNNVHPDYKVLYSADYAQAFIMNKAKNITEQFLDVRFAYKQWSESAESYMVMDTEKYMVTLRLNLMQGSGIEFMRIEQDFIIE